MKLAAFVLGLALSWLLSAWADMLLIGIAHRDWWPLLPTMSYHVALILSGVVLTFLFVITLAVTFMKELIGD